MSLTTDDGADDGWADDGTPSWTSDNYLLGLPYAGGPAPAVPGDGWASEGQTATAAAAGVLPRTIDRTLAAPAGALTRDHVLDQAGDMLAGLPPEQFGRLLGPTIDVATDLPEDDAGLRDRLARIRAQFPAAGEADGVGVAGASALNVIDAGSSPVASQSAAFDGAASDPARREVGVGAGVSSLIPLGEALASSAPVELGILSSNPVGTKPVGAGSFVARRAASKRPPSAAIAAGARAGPGTAAFGSTASSYPLPSVLKLPSGKLASTRVWELGGTPYRVIYDSSGCHMAPLPVTPEEVRRAQVGMYEVAASAAGPFAGFTTTRDNINHDDIEKQWVDVSHAAATDAALEAVGPIFGAVRTGRWEGLPEQGVPSIRGRRPKNFAFAGQTHPTGIAFTEQGFPDFSPYATKTVGVQGLNGRYRDDARAANRLTGLPRTPDGYVWHHHEDGYTMQLVPRSVHDLVDHTGGAAVVRNRGFDP